MHVAAGGNLGADSQHGVVAVVGEELLELGHAGAGVSLNADGTPPGRIRLHEDADLVVVAKQRESVVGTGSTGDRRTGHRASFTRTRTFRS